MITPVLDFGSNPGALDMYEHAPADLAAGRPVVVVMHGCTQQASSMEATGWDTLADELQFTVVYPQQRSANQPLGCFTWYSPADITRDSGEALSVMQMVDHVIAAHGSDPTRVYVTGLSAGGAFTSIMMATYPDRFAAGSVMAGIPYHCATDFSSAQACTMSTSGSQKTPMQWGDLVRAADPGFAGPYPRVQIFQGTADTTVAPANATELVKQWTNVWGTDQTADATSMVSMATRTQYMAGATVAVELYSIAGMGHAVAVGDDGSGPCPAHTATYFTDVHVCSTLRAAAFFGLTDDPGTGTGSDGGGGDDSGGGGCSATGGSRGGLSLFALLAACALAGRGRRAQTMRSTTNRRSGSNRRHRR